MLITRETDYTLRVLRALADGKQRSVVEICNVEGAPKQFVYKITKKLENNGWITITRGADGGCKLNTDLAKLSLYELIVAVDDDSFVSPCFSLDYECSYKDLGHENCAIHQGLCQIQKSIEDELKSYSILYLINYGK